ncbi:low temperature requirement protein A [Streptomyces sp. DSM 44917]|uniref:Low temperature requirement protein A n=1 Tax=Streptomyces boetiae TaxID=3075541 RepID=A0ABU2L340_9ACTN|nr:low temperature requirement protein A [Streptomyces sp. DSM 44917]MDT0305782.1 low temperature requirement protein A [Streptomyces sp. DSM 44917]
MSERPRPAGPWHRTMTGRDPAETHRAATPLELLFDLCFVVAVAQAAAALHHKLAEGEVGPGLLGYAMTFFAIWWAWMNFTWFASSYDTDDVPYRLLTLLQMAGVLVLAAGVEDALEHYDFAVGTFGYVLMRLAMVAQWLRAAREDPLHRASTLRYAVGVSLVQAGWVLRLALPHPLDYIGFAVLVVAELSVPAWAESRGRVTPWHPQHIAERYGLFTIIVLGEVILASLNGVRSALTERGASGGLLLLVVGGLLLVFGLWWCYFSGPGTRLPTLRRSLVWGYGHYLVFAAMAAVGAGLEVAVETDGHHTHISGTAAAWAVAVPVAVVLAALAGLHRVGGTGAARHPAVVAAGVAAVLACAAAAGPLTLAGAVAGMGLAVAGTLAVSLALAHHGRSPAPARPA